MLTNLPSATVTSRFDRNALRPPRMAVLLSTGGRARFDDGSDEPTDHRQRSRLDRGFDSRTDDNVDGWSDWPAADTIETTVEISRPDIVKRRAVALQGMAAEIVQATRREKIECRLRAPFHLLVVYEQGARLDGETFVEGLPRSTLRDCDESSPSCRPDTNTTSGRSRAILSRRDVFLFRSRQDAASLTRGVTVELRTAAVLRRHGAVGNRTQADGVDRERGSTISPIWKRSASSWRTNSCASTRARRVEAAGPRRARGLATADRRRAISKSIWLSRYRSPRSRSSSASALTISAAPSSNPSACRRIDTIPTVASSAPRHCWRTSALGDGYRIGAGLQRDELFLGRISQGDRAYADGLSPKPSVGRRSIALTHLAKRKVRRIDAP